MRTDLEGSLWEGDPRSNQKLPSGCQGSPGCLQGAVCCATGILCPCPWHKALGKVAVAKTGAGTSLKPQPVMEHGGCSRREIPSQHITK